MGALKDAVHPSSKAHGDESSIGKVVASRYRIEAKVGEGGMGIVYRARHLLIDRVVALKLIRPDLRGETHLRAWMLREARAANRVDHAHIVDIFDIGETDEGDLYLVMEYLVGVSLSNEIARGAFPLVRAVDILEQMGAALARAHNLGVVHRDLKSDNVMLTSKGGRRDSVKILDFGLADLARDPRLSPKGAVFGTPEYMSPEQARGEDATPKSDLYALGVLFFEMLTGRLPFKSHDRETLLEMQRTMPAPQPRQVVSDVNPTAEAIILKLLEKDPRKRFMDAHHLLEELKSLQRSLPSPQWELAPNDPAPAMPPTPPSARVTEWATWASMLTRMVARVYPNGNDPSEVASRVQVIWSLTAKASWLEGEVALHNRKLEALERNGRSVRAEIGRKVEELANEESRIRREAASYMHESEKLAAELRAAEHEATSVREAADRSETDGSQSRALFEKAGACAGHVQEMRMQLDRLHQRRVDKESAAAALRSQVDGLRSHLMRYTEALEEELSQRRDAAATGMRQGVELERQFDDATRHLIAHLRAKPECKDLMTIFLSSVATDRTRGV